MDYHFVKGKTTKPDDEKVFVLRQSLKKFTPVLALAALLPVFLFLLYAPPDLRYSPSADDSYELRIWLEPKTVVSTQGKTVEMDVVALFESESNKIIPQVTLELESTDGLALDTTSITSDKPFSGQKTLGSVTVTVGGSGEQSVSIVDASVEIIAFDEEIEIITSPATVYVK